MLSKVPICAATSWAKGCICCCCIWTGTEPPNIQRRDMKRSKILHSSKCRFSNEFRFLFYESGESEPRTKQSLGYRWIQLGQWSLAACCSCCAWIVVPSPENSLESAFPSHSCHRQAPGNLCFGDHPSVLQLQRSGCGNCWKLADCCGNCCWKLLPCWCWVCLGIRIFTWWTSHFSDLPRTQPSLPTAQFDGQVTVIVGKALDRLAWEVEICDLWIYDTIRNLLPSQPMQSTSRLWMVNANIKAFQGRHKIWR